MMSDFDVFTNAPGHLHIVPGTMYPRLEGLMTLRYHMFHVDFYKRKKKDENVVLECVIILPNPF